MAYQTGSATDLEDLVSDLFTFLTGATAAWTQDELDTTNNYGTIHKNNVYVSFRWDDSPGNYLAVYQSLGWTASTLPHNQDDDSGQGDTTTPIGSGRGCNMLGAGPYTAYYFFASDSAPFYCHVVVEPSSGRYRHFGFGELDKEGDWTGGEYCYAHYWDQSSIQVDLTTSTLHSFGMDGNSQTTANNATIHAEGLPDQGASENAIGSAARDAGHAKGTGRSSAQARADARRSGSAARSHGAGSGACKHRADGKVRHQGKRGNYQGGAERAA